MKLIDQLLSVANAYRLARGLSTGRVSFLVFGDGKVLGALERDGRDITTRRLEAAVQWFSANWPESAAWPEGVTRPAPAEKAEDAA